MFNLILVAFCAGWFGYALRAKDGKGIVFSLVLACLNLGIGLYIIT